MRLIQGASKANQWQIDSSTNRAQLTVGADKACDWPIAAGGVAAIHFELFWDGRRLWIADTHEAGGVTVDGTRLASWQPITGRARIEFGSAVMVAECSVPAVSVEQRPPMASPMPDLSMDLEPTRRPGQAGGAVPGDDERTTLHVRHDSQPAGKGHEQDRVPLHAAPTTISEMPEGMTPFGGPPPMPPGSGMSPPAILQSRMPVMPVPTIIAEPGRGLPPPGMLQMPNPPMARGGMGMGMSTPDPGGARPGMPPGMGMGMPTPDPAAAMRPGMMGPPMQPPGMAPMPTPTGRPAWMDRLGLPKTSVPLRTWGLVIVTVAALMVVMFMGGGNQKEAPRRRAAKKASPALAATQPPDQAQPAAAGGQPAASGTEPAAGTGQPAGNQTEVAPSAGKTGEGKTPEGKTPEAKTPETKTPETKTPEAKTPETKTPETKTPETKTPEAKTPEAKTPEGKTPPASKTASGDESASGATATPAQGADLLLAGRQREAIAVYDELARRYPERREYAAILKILKRRLAERCKEQQPGDSPCPPVQ